MNNKSFLLIGAVFMVSNTLCISYLFSVNNESAQPDISSQISKSVVPKVSFSNEEQANGFVSLENKMEHLVQEVLIASTEIMALKTELKNIKDNANSHNQHKDDVPQLIQAEVQQRQAEAKQQYVSNLQSAPRNVTWASQMEYEMLSSIENAQLSGFGQNEVSVQGIECFSDNCLIDVTLSDSDNESLILAMLPWAVTAEFIPSENDLLKGRMVITKI